MSAERSQAGAAVESSPGPARRSKSAADKRRLILDAAVRETPHDAYEPDFMNRLRSRGIFGGIPTT